MTLTDLSPVPGTQLYLGDCRRVLAELPDNSVDSVVTDPPYEIGFRGRKWDSSGIAFDPVVWSEALRVLKPGGHLLAAGGSRTYHRMACGIEDAGFEIRDCISWLYGSGFPHGANVSKLIDKKLGAQRTKVRHKVQRSGVPGIGMDEHRPWTKRAIESDGFHEADSDVPVTDAAKRWDGWNTALKPGYEPFVLARKPLSESNIAGNVLAHGTGGINIGACRIGDEVRDFGRRLPKKPCVTTGDFTKEMPPRTYVGRWPANAIVDETVAKQLGESAKFFYCGKAPQKERPSYTNASGKTIKHSTVKPLSLMRYLVRLVTPPGGTVLDPFAGSGATLEAAQLEGFSSIGIELGEDHIPLILQRLDRSAAA